MRILNRLVLLAALGLSILLGSAVAADEILVAPGHLLALGQDGPVQISASELQPQTTYVLRIICYQDPPGAPPGKSTPESRVISEHQVEFLASSPAYLTDTRQRMCYHPRQVEQYEARVLHTVGAPLPPLELEEATNSTRIVAFGPQVAAQGGVQSWPQFEQGFWPPVPGQPQLPQHLPLSGRDSLILENADRVLCGDLTVLVHCPPANRIEVYAEQYQRWTELVYSDGVTLPELRQHRSEPVQHGWTNASLRASDLGFLFADGTPMPDEEGQARLFQRVEAARALYAQRSAELKARAEEKLVP